MPKITTSADTVSNTSDSILTGIFPAATQRDHDLSERFIIEGILESKNYGDISFGQNFWACGPQSNRTWKWTLHAFLPLDPLIAIGESEVLDALVRSWRWQHEHSPLSDDFPWHDHATALRLDRLSRMGASYPDCRYPDLVAQHADILLDDSFYSKHTNHGFDQAVSLILASSVFSELPNAATWKQIGTERLIDEIRYAFTDEGVHVENSPSYHVGMISNLVRARKVLNNAGVDDAIDFDRLYDNALRFAAWMTRPDRFLAYLGDTSSYRPNVPAELSSCPSYSMVRWAGTGGTEGKQPTQTSVVFEQSGYAIYRSSWKPWKTHTHIIMKSGFLSSYHRHDDDLNILLHAHGQDWLIDSGLYSHNQTDPARIYMRSALAHNVPYLQGKTARRTKPGPKAASIKELKENNAEFAVIGRTRMYPGTQITRRLSIANANEFRISDEIDAPSNLPRYWLFHVPGDKRVSVSPGTSIIRGKQAIFAIKSSDPELPSAVYSGLEAKFPSLFSAQQNIHHDSKVIVFGPTKKSSMRFRCWFRKGDS